MDLHDLSRRQHWHNEVVKAAEQDAATRKPKPKRSRRKRGAEPAKVRRQA